MLKTFLFIIPLTPADRLSNERKHLRALCLNTLLSQTYTGWKALLIGKSSEIDPKNERFVYLDHEGAKEEKLQKATEYIANNKVQCDYIIRLDDDDVFNPRLLNDLKEKNFDLCVDQYHSFWNVASGKVAQRVMYWFPNTCIHKKEHALAIFGTFPPGEYQRFKELPLLIENEHNDFNKYYSQKHSIIYTKQKQPLYLRSLSTVSITSLQAKDHNAYLNQHGYWKKNKFKSFLFLNKYVLAYNNAPLTEKQSLKFYFKSMISDKRALKSYHNIIIKK